MNAAFQGISLLHLVLLSAFRCTILLDIGQYLQLEALFSKLWYNSVYGLCDTNGELWHKAWI